MNKLNKMLKQQEVIISSTNCRGLATFGIQDFAKWKEVLPELSYIWSLDDIMDMKMKKSIDTMLKERKSKDELIKINEIMKNHEKIRELQLRERKYLLHQLMATMGDSPLVKEANGSPSTILLNQKTDLHDEAHQEASSLEGKLTDDEDYEMNIEQEDPKEETQHKKRRKLIMPESDNEDYEMNTKQEDPKVEKQHIKRKKLNMPESDNEDHEMSIPKTSTIPSQEVLHQKSELPLADNGLAIRLLRHQVRALLWMSKKETKRTPCCGGILADDQGLGKTVSAIALILKERSPPCSIRVEDKEIETLNLDENENTKHPVQTKNILPAGTLIVCPTSVLRQWNEELHTKVVKEASLSVLVYYGGKRTQDPFELAKHDVVITTYAIVSIEVPKQPLDEDETTTSTESTDYPLAKLRWFRVVLDESQSIKNYKTQVARACWGLTAERRWCLSGTPIQNSVDDLYSYFRFLKYKQYAVFKSFCAQIRAPIQKNPTVGYKKLQEILKKIMLRRTKGTLVKGEPIISLPPKTVTLKRVDFSPEERDFYHKLEAESRAMFAKFAAAGTLKQNYTNILLMLLRLRQACDHPSLVKGCKSSINCLLSVEKAKQLPQEELNRLLNCLEASVALCSICDDPPEDAVVTTCEHVFCNQCILQHLSTDDSRCPFSECKEVLNRSLIYSKSALTDLVNDSGSEEVKVMDPLKSSKIKAAIEVLQSIAVKEKAIVFSQWTGVLDCT